MYYATNCKNQHWDLIIVAMSVLNTYVDYDLNGLDTYTSSTMYEQDLVMVQGKRTDYAYMHTIACVLYSM